MGVETVIGDIKDRGSLPDAFAGIDAIISTASSTFSRQEGDSIETVDSAGQLNVVEAAKEAGVKHLVFISFNKMAEDFALQRAKRTVEKSIMESGITYTILQPTFFMEAWLSPAVGFDYPNLAANIYGEGKNKISWISLSDVAAFAVASLDNPKARNKIFELGGPEALSPLEVVRIFKEEGGKSFSLQHVPEEALRGQKSSAQDTLSESFAGLMLYYARGSEVDVTTVADAFTITLTPVKSYAQRVMAS